VVARFSQGDPPEVIPLLTGSLFLLYLQFFLNDGDIQHLYNPIYSTSVGLMYKGFEKLKLEIDL
jgi:hypothetical protein